MRPIPVLTLRVLPGGGRFVEFLRLEIRALDDGQAPVAVAPFEILLTRDGSIPGDGNPATQVRRSPVLLFPVDRPTTLKLFARSVADHAVATTIRSEFYDVVPAVPVRSIRTAPGVANWTLQVDETGDLVRRLDGRYGVVFGLEKASQDVRESILVASVPRGEPIGNRTLPSFGSALSRLLGQALPPDFVVSEVRSSIFSALAFLQQLQREERVPATEQIDRILGVHVAAIDPTIFRYQFSVQVEAGPAASESGTIRLGV